MTPFRLNCPNCQSLIIVRQAYLVGQTLPCPKCKDLFTVQDPTQPIASLPRSTGPDARSTGPEAASISGANTISGTGSKPPSEQKSAIQVKEGSLPSEKQSVPPATPIASQAAIPSITPSIKGPNSKHLDSTALTKDDYGDWEAVLANIPQNLTEAQLENIAWDQVESDQLKRSEPSLSSNSTPLSAPPPPVVDNATFPDELQEFGVPNNEPVTPYRGETSFPMPGAASQPTKEVPPAPKAIGKKQLVLVASIGLASTLVAGASFWGFLTLVSNNKQVAQNSGESNVIPEPDKNTTGEETLSVNTTAENTADANIAGDAESSDIETTNADPSQMSTSSTSEETGVEQSAQDIETLSNESEPTEAPGTNELLNVDDTDDSSLLPDILKLPGELSSNDANDASSAQPANNKPGAAPEPSSSVLTEGASSSDATDANANEASDQLPDIFGPNGFGQLLTPHMNIEDTNFSGKAPIDELDLERLDEINTVYSHPDPQPVPLWSDKANSLTIPRIRFSNQTLVSCIDLFSRMTGIGITVDWPSLRAVGLSESTPISNDLQDQTLEQIVQSILDINDLQLDVPDDGLPLVRPKPSDEVANSSQSNWDLDSILANALPTPDTGGEAVVASGNNANSSLAQQLVELWGIQNYCVAEGNKLRWQSGAPALAKASVWTTLQLLARLNDGRSLEWTEPTDAPLSLFDPEDWHQSQALLTKQVPANVHLPELRPVSEILAITAKELGAELVVDWQAVWQHGLVPTQSEISVLRNRTLLQISKRYRDQYSLDLVTIGKNKVLLTTPEARKRRYIVLPLKLAEGSSLDELKRSLYLLAPIGQDGKSLFKVVPVPGTSDLFLARVVLPMVSQLDDDELHFALGWEKPTE